ncbi:hypothetical protein FHS81_002134 [Pseudochelatococcus contaminans]|uniref:Uncharacterized protein n=1 Tax=Pseudochelatococcus contaminans TaxID=1538103 RepID=A0A7W5Z5W9_9HYPH|nr:hypothetical protein [Pseudochelatococcus contaminans]
MRLAMKAAHMDRTHADVSEQRVNGLRQIRDRSRRPAPAARNSTPVR